MFSLSRFQTLPCASAVVMLLATGGSAFAQILPPAPGGGPPPAAGSLPTLAPAPLSPELTPPRASAPAPAAPAAAAQGPAAQNLAPIVKPKPKPKPAPPREMALATDHRPSLQPETFFATAKASERYAEIADTGGWPTVSALAPGASGKAVATLRRRLAIEGDLAAGQGEGEQWDEALTAAVKRFQSRMGLRQTGVVSGATLKAMNVPAAVRFRQLASSAQRIAGSTFGFGQKYVVVNIPSASVEAVEDGRVVRRYTAVVGDVKHPSPEVATRVVAINLNPTWTLPTSIIKNEIIPKMRKDPGYLARSKIRILDSSGAEVDPTSVNWSTEHATSFTLRQDSGIQNALGSIRINMPNSQAVYMHDTPSKRFFNTDYRFLSHGCVRVEGVYDLAAWLLDSSGRTTKENLLEKQKSGERIDLRLPQPVPVAWIYMTGWASADGMVNFRDDVYGYDRIGGSAHTAAR